jgi:hypothetical protein
MNLILDFLPSEPCCRLFHYFLKDFIQLTILLKLLEQWFVYVYHLYDTAKSHVRR